MCSASAAVAAAAALATNRGNTFLAGEQLLHGARGSDCLHFTCFAVQQGKQKQNSKITTTREGEGEGVEGGKRSTRLGQATDNLVANNGGHCLVTVPRSLFTNHRSLFTAHCSLFTVHFPAFTVHCGTQSVTVEEITHSSRSRSRGRPACWSSVYRGQ